MEQLVAALKKYPKKSLIVMASDPEGNEAYTLRGVEPSQVVETESELSFELNQPESYDPNNPGGNAVYFLADYPVDEPELPPMTVEEAVEVTKNLGRK